MLALYEKFIRPSLTNVSWRPSRELVLAGTVLAILLTGFNDVASGDIDWATAAEVAATAIIGLFVRGHVTSVSEPRDQDGHLLRAVDSSEG